MDFDVRELIVGQLEFYWDVILWPRLDGLTDDEYLWEPVDGCWSVRPDDNGQWQLDGPWSDPGRDPEPVTTIAWRMMHLASGCFGSRASTYFGDGSVPDDADMFDLRHLPTEYPGTASDGLAFLDRFYRQWHDGIASLDDDALIAKLGPKGAEYADDTMAGLIVHLNREAMHHGGEIGVMRDLYRAKFK
jgi:hypothetical protein